LKLGVGKNKLISVNYFFMGPYMADEQKIEKLRNEFVIEVILR
jgi:hypothetical protein